MKKDSISASLPTSKTVRGYEIKKMPLGAFLQASKTLQTLPEELMQAIYPGMGVEEIFKELGSLTKDTLITLIARAVVTLPEKVIHLFAELSRMDEDELVNDPNVGLDGLVELIDAWIEVNGIGNFTSALKLLVAKLQGMTSIGSKD